MEKPSLLGDASDSDVEFGINEEYAKSYKTWREKEEMQKLKDKYGDLSTLSSSEDDELPKVDESFYKALSLVKSRDSKMYEINNTVVPDSEVKPKKSKEKKPKPLYLKDYERKVALETGGQFSDYEDEPGPEKKLSYDEEQEQIRKSFKGFDLSEDDDDDSSDILNVRSTTKAEQEKLEENYIAYLKGDTQLAKEVQDEKKDLAFLRNYWNDPKLSEDEKFLRDYFLNAKYEEEDTSGTIPTYEDITNDVGGESEEEAAAEFEQKYNFRFEEPDSEFIKRYPRTMKDSLRKKDQRRKTKREERAERKQLEKIQRREEIKQLKALKRKEIEEKLKLLRETLHDENIALKDVDLEGDFDPEEHDQKMSKMFSDQYYDVPEEEKPSFPEDEDLDFEDWDNWTGNNDGDAENNDDTNEEGPPCKDPGFNMDADCEDPKLAFQKEMMEASKPRSKKKKKSYFSSAVSKKKPVFDPSDKPFEQYLNEYYRLDCEDFIGDLPTRFRYREVVPNDFGLSVDEILAAEDKELNQWCSLKRVCQNRTKDEELYDVQAYKKKALNELKKKRVFTTLYNESENDSTEKKTKKQKKAKKSNENSDSLENEISNQPATANSTEQGNDDGQVCTANSDQGMKKKKKKKAKKLNENSDLLENEVSNKPAAANSAEQGNDDSQVCTANSDQVIKKKKKAKKLNENSDSLENEVSNKPVTANSAEQGNGDSQVCTANADHVDQGIKKKNQNRDTNEGVDRSSTETLQDPKVPLSPTKDSTVDIPSNKRKHVEEQTDTTQENDSLNTSGQSRKKKKRKPNKEVTSEFQAHNSRNEETSQFTKPHKRKHGKHKPSKVTDKRLLLSDKRLEAYGINPKKFKNKIRFSNK